MKTQQEAKQQTTQKRSSQRKDSLAWTTLQNLYVPRVYAALQYLESTIATLLYTKAISFNDFLYQVGVLDTRPQCLCEQEHQTLKHVVMFYSRLQGHNYILVVASTIDYSTLLSTTKELHVVALQLIQTRVLAQFTIAKEIGEENRDSQRPLLVLVATNVLLQQVYGNSSSSGYTLIEQTTSHQHVVAIVYRHLGFPSYIGFSYY